MSLIKLQGNASGTGAFTIAAPNGNTDRTLTLPDATGTVNVSGLANEVPAGSAGAPAIYPTGDTNTGIFFPAADTIAFAEGGSESMRIDSSGNVGIGTSSPGARLEVTGEARIYPSSGAANLRFGSGGAEKAKLAVDTSSNMIFETAGAERARIDASGNLLVGTTNGGLGATNGVVIGPSESAWTTGTSAVVPIRIYNKGTAGARYLMEFRNSSNAVGAITHNNSSTTYSTSSDYRLKEDWQPMAGASERVLALKPVNFAWKVDGSRVDGFLAHEVQAVVPEAVTGAKDEVDADGNPQYQGIDQSKLVPLLTAALQEALAEIANLKTRLIALEAN